MSSNELARAQEEITARYKTLSLEQRKSYQLMMKEVRSEVYHEFEGKPNAAFNITAKTQERASWILREIFGV